MADYIYLLENRLSEAQRTALRIVRELARSRNLTVFLVGGAVRDLTTGSPVRDLDVVVQGNALKLKKDLQAAGATLSGENEAGQALFLTFPGSVRMEFGSTLVGSWPKPGKPVYKLSGIQDDLRRRDFTANAMALSLNEGSYGLLIDPLNGIADIENRELRLVSNYGFIEEPVRMIRAARLMARLGWSMDEKTLKRYETGKAEDFIATLSAFHSGYELEEIVHEEDPLRVLKRLETEGWMKVLAPFWTTAKANVAELEHLRDVQTKLQMQGILPHPATGNYPLLTAKLSAAESNLLKSSFPRQGFVAEIEALEGRAKELSAQLGAKSVVLPSQAWKIMTSAAPEVVLWLMFSTRSVALQAKFTAFTETWPQARQKIPYASMQEMRIVPELPGYQELVEKLFFALMDDQLQTTEEIKAFLEPFSPPAPPPPLSLRRSRVAKKDAKASKARGKKTAASIADDEDEAADESPLRDVEVEQDGVDDEPLDLPTMEDEIESSEVEEPGDREEEEEELPPSPPPVRPTAKKLSVTKSVASKKLAKAMPVKVTKVKPVLKQIAVIPRSKSPAKVAASPAKKVGAKAVAAKKTSAPVKATPPQKLKQAKAAHKPAPSEKKLPAKKQSPPPPPKKGTKAAVVLKKAAPVIPPTKAIPAARKTVPPVKASKKSVKGKKR